MKSVKPEELAGLVGTEIGTSRWLEIKQERVNDFADVTEDHQFIHVNPEAAKMTPFGGTVAHGLLTLSLLPKFGEDASLILEGIRMGVNYGFEKVRFLAPVKMGKKVRGIFVLKAAEEKRPGEFLITYAITVEIEGEEKPALVADWLALQLVAK